MFMKVTFNSSAQQHATLAMRRYVQQAANNCLDCLDESAFLSLTFSYKSTKGVHKVKFAAALPTGTIRAESSNSDFYMAVDKAAHILEQSLIKHINRLKHPSKKQEPARTKHVPAQKLTRDEAAARMNDLGYDFLLFVDSDSGNPCAVYARDEGYGHISMEEEEDEMYE